LTDRKHRTADQARKSVLMVAGVFLLLAAWNVWRDRPAVYFTLVALAVVLGLVGLLWPRGALAFDRTWMLLAGVLGYINSRILLSVMFYGVMAPYGWLMRLFGRNTMNRRGRGAETYWIPRKRTRQMPAQFERQF
jgi:Saxitoxin biosynthesis operon protein SxtJ